MDAKGPPKRVAIVYHYLAHYREAVFAALSRSDTRHRYVIFSDRVSNIPSLATIPPQKSRSVDPDGALDWRFIRNRWLTPNVLWQSGALRVALSREFDTVILLGNMRFLSTWMAALLARATGKRVLMWTHGVLRRERGAVGLARRLFYHLAHGLLLYGHRARDLLSEAGFAADRLYVVFNSLDTASQLRALAGQDDASLVAARRARGIPPSARLLVYVGRLVAGKELHLLPAAVSGLRARGHDVHLMLVGGGPGRADVERQVEELGVAPHVHFAGEVYSEMDLCPLIAAADLCVSPGAVGLTVMHALVYGTPVITHDDLDNQKPEFEAIQPGVTGALFRRGDVESLVTTIEAWLSVDRDRARERVMCRESLLRFYTPMNQREIIDRAVDAVPASLLHGAGQAAGKEEGAEDAATLGI
jgi:glycosyltransferase involved in cell wall biosynthesis